MNRTKAGIYKSAKELVEDWPYTGTSGVRRMHFTSGCLDILHAGHAAMLDLISQCAGTEPVIVGINSDESVSRIKGIDRPIVRQEQRAFMLSCLRSVDQVFIFNEDTVVKSLKTLRPALWYKGGDYTLATLNQDERKTAEEIGTRIVILEKFGDYSTTEIVRRLKG